MSEGSGKSDRRVPLWVKVLLGLSLALNLAVIGLVAGVAIRFGDGDRRPVMANYAIPYVMSLPRDDRRGIGKTLRRDTREGRLPQRKSRIAHYEAMLVLLEAEDWDQDAAVEILALQGQDSKAVQSAAQSAWIKTVSAYTVEERRAYAERLRENLRRVSGKRKKPRN